MEIWVPLSIFLVIDTLILIYVLFYKKSSLSDKERVRYLEMWQGIKQQGDRHAVMEADKLLDVLLKKKGYQGSLGDKLKNGNSLFVDINGVWSAHKLRNRIAHELDYHPSNGEISTAMKQFDRAFRDLGLS